jgi:hypothetical protein
MKPQRPVYNLLSTSYPLKSFGESSTSDSELGVIVILPYSTLWTPLQV